MSKRPESKERIVKRVHLECPVCHHKKFWERKTLMNTPGMTIAGIEWANKKALNYVCENCGYVYWFLE
jgi:predicted nucleic-acid-binding Zn-ribbon protein